MENTTPTMIQKLKRVHLTVYILIAMLLGVIIGWGFPTFSKTYLVLLSSSIFLPMVKACIVPLVFSTLVVGIAGFGNDTGRVGRLFLKSMIYFVLLTGLALFIGLAVVNIINPGIGVDLSKSEETKNPDIAFISLKAELGKIFQPSFFQAAVGFRPNGTPAGSGGEILAIVFMACIFAIAIMKTKDDSAKSTMLAFNRSLSEIMFSVVNIIMLFAPFGVFGAMAAAVGNHGLTVLFALGKLIGALYLGLVIFILLILLPIMLIFKVNIIKFFKALAEPLAIAFSTASSDAALPLVMENMIEFGVPKYVVSLVIPTGYTFNLDGTTLYLAVASVFSAQASEVSMSLGQQVYMMLILMLTSKGVAAVPRASLVVLAATIDQFGFNPAVITLILGVDEIMDMARTAVNVIGNALASVVIAKLEGVFELGDIKPENKDVVIAQSQDTQIDL